MKFKWTVEIDINLEGDSEGWNEALTEAQAKCAFSQARTAFFDSLCNDSVEFKVTKEKV